MDSGAPAELAGFDPRLPASWDHLAQRDPREVLARAAGVIAEPASPIEATALAHNARSRALLDLGRLTEARPASQQAIEWGSRCPQPELRRRVLLSSAAVLAESGSLDVGLDTLHELAATCDGVELGRVRLQIAYVLHHAGRLNEALEHLERADRDFGPHGDPLDRVRVHSHRGLVLLQQNRLDPAEADFQVAAEISAQLGLDAFLAQSLTNIAVVRGRARRLTDSMAYFDRAAEAFARAGNPARGVTGMQTDRAEVMLHSGLVTDALVAARGAVDAAAQTGNRAQLGDAQLMLARAELAAGRRRDAARAAEAAAATFTASGRPEMVAHARCLGAIADLERAGDADATGRLLDDSRQLVVDLLDAGWEQMAHDLAVARLRVASRHGDEARVAADLEHLRLGVFGEQRDLQLAGWYAEALCRRLGGEDQSSLDACRAGLDLVDEIVAEAPSLPERSAAMRLARDLSQLTIEIAVDVGDAHVVWAAAEGTRARALHDELAGQHRHRPLTVEGAAALQREIAARLGDRSLVEWVVARDRIHAVVFDAAGSRLIELGEIADVVRARDRVLMWLDVAASEPDVSSDRASRAAAALDELLIEPLRLPPDNGVVLVPVDMLHGMPWAALPSLVDRPFALAPNAQLWLEADRRSAGAVRSVGMIVGPGVDATEVERSAVERCYEGAAYAAGAGATSATVMSMFAHYDLVHVAAHGRFRSDRPLLSTLWLDGGDRPLDELVPERVHARVVVMSSCEGGAQGTSDGSEVLGLSAVMLARGASSVLAPLTVVRELECADFVAEVHDELTKGEPFACAVADVRRRWLAADDLSRWAVASSFSCFGSGATQVV